MTEPLEARLIRLAEAATPGPLRLEVLKNDVWALYEHGKTTPADYLVISGTKEQDGRLIAALSPSTVILLARVVEAARHDAGQDEFSCPKCEFEPGDGSLVMCDEHERFIRPLSVESLRLMVIDNMVQAYREARALAAFDASQEENRP